MRSVWHQIETVFDERALQRAKAAVSFFYYFLAAALFSGTTLSWEYLTSRKEGILEPFWPVFWVRYVSYETALFALLGLLVVSGLCGALFHQKRSGRILPFVGVFEYHGFASSFGQPNHEWYLMLYIAAFFIFLPDIWDRRETETERKRFLWIFFLALSYFMLTYTMAGMWKIANGIEQYRLGAAGLFSPDAAALHVAYWLNATARTSLLGAFVIEHQVIGWFAFLVFAYFQTTAIIAAFRPALHRIWGAALILFHLGTLLSMNVIFALNTFLLFIFLFHSPFERPARWKTRLLEIPGIRAFSVIISLVRKKSA